MKKTQLLFTALLVPVDFLMLLLAGIAAYRFRIDSFVTEIRPVIYALSFADYISYVIIAAIIWQILFVFNGLYTTKSTRTLSKELGKIFMGCSIGLLVIVFAIFLQRELFSSRFIILMAWALAIAYVFVGRIIVLAIQRAFLLRGIGATNIILIGQDAPTMALLSAINTHPKHGFVIVKHIPQLSDETRDIIIKLKKKYDIDEVVVGDAHISREQMLGILEITEELHLGFRYAADLFNAAASNTSIEAIAGLPLIEIKKTNLEGWGRIVKRIFDVIASLALIILTSPLLIIAALAVRLTSIGPVIYKNERVGQKGEFFDTFKFRSMYSQFSVGKQFANTQAALKVEEELKKTQNTRSGPLYKITNDPRITPVGKFIRRWSIDELPQLFNVLFGDMSLVGPRPHQPREVALYQMHHKRLLTIKPGVTGMAQVSGRSDLSFEDEARLDIYYIENWSLWLDIQILLKTPFAVLKSRKTE
ncbi:sugar transferase [Candidatus Falkowbacteria bacterium]|nr:sugar transferase [Candidatus Falkowbacteria bacterium]